MGYPKFSKPKFGFMSRTKCKQVLLLVMISFVFADDRKEPVASLVASERIIKADLFKIKIVCAKFVIYLFIYL